MRVETIPMSMEEYRVLSSEYGGVCLACGSEAYGVEPDACGYDCECCGEPAVFGIEELMLMGRIELVEK